MDIIDFFKSPNSVAHKQYEALRMYYMEGVSAQQVAEHFGYTYRAFTSLVSSFRRKVIMNPKDSIFFVENAPGRKVSIETSSARSVVIDMRKKYYSVPEIKVVWMVWDTTYLKRTFTTSCKQKGFHACPDDQNW